MDFTDTLNWITTQQWINV